MADTDKLRLLTLAELDAVPEARTDDRGSEPTARAERDARERRAELDEERALIAGCQRGEREAQGRFYRRYRSEVLRRLCRVLGPQADDLDDALQETFIEVFRSIARFRGEARITTWLYRVSANVALQRLRKRRRLAEVPGEEHGPRSLDRRDDRTPQRQLEERERMRAVYRILDTLAPKKRLVFVMHEIDELEPREIATIIGAPVITVRTRLHYARKEFYARAALEPAFDGTMRRGPSTLPDPHE